MTKAFVLMTALPPTKGHINLVRFAAELPVDEVRVIVCTQPIEPYAKERYEAVKKSVSDTPKVKVYNLHGNIMQDPEEEGFWPMWDRIMRSHGFTTGDFCVTSELYGQTLANRLGGVFMPYDPLRELYYTKATNIRNDMINYFRDILPEFQHNLRTTVTVFGAESTGKTTLSKELAATINAHWLFEYARPYLEAVGPEISIDSMNAIWRGQLAIQQHAKYLYDKPFVVQDTDLFSTVGYWAQSHWAEYLGAVPSRLVIDAQENMSDLYIITQSNIEFEPDPIRYGGDHRESPDSYWIDLAERFGLNYVVLDHSDPILRASWAAKHAREEAGKKAESIYYDRRGL